MEQGVGRALDDLEVFSIFFRKILTVDEGSHADDAVEGRAQLVAHVGQELAFDHRGHLGFFEVFFQLHLHHLHVGDVMGVHHHVGHLAVFEVGPVGHIHETAAGFGVLDPQLVVHHLAHEALVEVGLDVVFEGDLPPHLGNALAQHAIVVEVFRDHEGLVAELIAVVFVDEGEAIFRGVDHAVVLFHLAQDLRAAFGPQPVPFPCLPSEAVNVPLSTRLEVREAFEVHQRRGIEITKPLHSRGSLQGWESLVPSSIGVAQESFAVNDSNGGIVAVVDEGPRQSPSK